MSCFPVSAAASAAQPNELGAHQFQQQLEEKSTREG